MHYVRVIRSVLSDVQPRRKARSRALAETDPDLPVVLITGFGLPSLARTALQHGACDFITKPSNSTHSRSS